MKFNDIFARRVDRHLDGVIKPDKNEHLASELEEYVITPEIRRSLQRFCDEYNNPYSEGNGAWISGFYGSGKSHLLKMLSYLIENPDVTDENGVAKPALDYIKPKLKDDPMLLGALERTCERTPSKSILFSIGAKADTGNTRDALLSAFIKVLNEACGYFAGTKAYIASFERDLDRIGLYQTFVGEFEHETGRRWDVARRKRTTAMAGDISRVYDRVTGNPEGTHTDVLEQYARDYHPSHEDFADWCSEYLEKQGPDFRLNFFVDEMGQFIGANDDLLFSLQNIAELLNSRCHGRAWVIVVSQENVEDIIGDFRTRGSAKDFTKIQARFKVKIKIPSNDANTVVRDRLLEKAPSALGAIDRLYERYHGDFKVLFDFPNGAKHYALYKDEGDFEAYYPMVPYQFPLFHKALTGLSDHNAFTGEYTSTGARNMLGATRNVLLQTKDTGDVEAGDLVSFDLMFEGLYTDLKSEAFEAISTAQDHFGYDDGGLGLRILKVLLLVKYNEEFAATPANLRVLLYRSFSEDAVNLEERIKDSLRHLEAENYVRRNGDAYEYLTDEEKDIEAEIKREVVTDAEIRNQIGKLFKEDVVRQTRVQYVNGDFSSPYPYDVQVDGIAVGTSANALTLNILTDLYEGARERFVLVAGNRELACALPPSTDLISEVRLWIQTNRYVSRNMRGEDLRARILQEKHSANSKRHDELKERLKELVASAQWATCNVDVTDDVKGQGAERVDAAVRIMIGKSYPMLSLLRSRFDNTSIYKAATDSKLMPGESLAPFAKEVLDEVGRILSAADRCTVGGGGSNSLETRLGGGQYGWPAAAVRQAVGTLACNGLVECCRSDAVLEGAALGRDLSQGRSLGDVVVTQARVISPEALAALREAHKAIVGVTSADDDPRAIADAIHTDLGSKLSSYSDVASKVHGYPFSLRYEEELGVLRVAADRKRDWLIANIAGSLDEIVGACNDLRDMAGFVNGSQGKRYDEAADFLRTQDANIASCDAAGRSAEQMRAVLQDPDCWNNGTIPQLRRLQREATDAIEAELKDARAEAHAELGAFVRNFRLQDYAGAGDEAKARADALFARCASCIEASGQIQVVRGIVDRFKKEQTARLYDIVAPAPEPVPDQSQQDGDEGDGEQASTQPRPAKPSTMTVMFSDVAVPDAFKGCVLATEEDVRAFVGALQEQLAEQVRNNSKIIL